MRDVADELGQRSVSRTRALAATFVVSVVVSVVVGGCSSKAPAPPPDLFGKSVEPPAPLAKVRGLSMDEVKRLYPEAKPDERFSGSPSLKINAPPGLRYTITFYSDIDRVADTHVQAPGHDLVALAKKAWGPGKPSGMQPRWTEWHDDATGYTATATGAGITFRGTAPLAPAYFGIAPSLPGNWKSVKLGAKKADVKPSSEEQPADVSINPRYRDDELEALDVRLPARAAKMIEEAWGPGTKSGDDLVWFDNASGIRATLSGGAYLVLDHYVTYSALFGGGTGDMGRVPVNLEGRSKDEVKKALGDKVQVADNMMLSLGTAKHGGQTASLNCLFMPEARCTLTVPYETNTAARDEMIVYMTAVWGAPTATTPDRKFKVGPHVIKVVDWSGQLMISVEKK